MPSRPQYPDRLLTRPSFSLHARLLKRDIGSRSRFRNPDEPRKHLSRHIQARLGQPPPRQDDHPTRTPRHIRILRPRSDQNLRPRRQSATPGQQPLDHISVRVIPVPDHRPPAPDHRSALSRAGPSIPIRADHQAPPPRHRGEVPTQRRGHPRDERLRIINPADLRRRRNRPPRHPVTPTSKLNQRRRIRHRTDRVHPDRMTRIGHRANDKPTSHESTDSATNHHPANPPGHEPDRHTTTRRSNEGRPPRQQGRAFHPHCIGSQGDTPATPPDVPTRRSHRLKWLMPGQHREDPEPSQTSRGPKQSQCQWPAVTSITQ